MKEYPLILTTVEGELSLYIPDPEQVKPVYEQNLLEDKRAPFPFWAKVWASSLALTSYIKKNQDLVNGKRVIEIGAGIGLPSFTIAQWAATIIISDHVLAAVKLMQKNIEHCRLTNITAMCLDWNHFPEEIKAEVVLLSDINYAPEQFSSLLILIHRFLAENAVVIIATPQRLLGAPFVEALLPKVITNQLFYKEDVAIRILLLLNHKKE